MDNMTTRSPLAAAADQAEVRVFELRCMLRAYSALAGLINDDIRPNTAYGFEGIERGDVHYLVLAVNRTVEEMVREAHDAAVAVNNLVNGVSPPPPGPEGAPTSNVFHGDVGVVNVVGHGAMNNHGKPTKKRK